jgi:dTDP-4-amino-4,6-dideoxygalactose transaminase
LCPKAEQYYEEALTLPIFPRMTDADVRDVILAVTKVIGTYMK